MRLVWVVVQRVEPPDSLAQNPVAGFLDKREAQNFATMLEALRGAQKERALRQFHPEAQLHDVYYEVFPRPMMVLTTAIGAKEEMAANYAVLTDRAMEENDVELLRALPKQGWAVGATHALHFWIADTALCGVTVWAGSATTNTGKSLKHCKKCQRLLAIGCWHTC